MIKTLSNVLKQDKEKFMIPRKVQDLIPIKAIWPDGVFLNSKGKYSKLLCFEDINFASESYDNKYSCYVDLAVF